MNLYHLIIYTPLSHAERVRLAAADAGAGQIGNYDSCSFSAKGTGRFRPNDKANPHIGTAGEVEEVEEERLEVVVPEDNLKEVITEITKAHPYEEPAIHVLPMLDYHDL